MRALVDSGRGAAPGFDWAEPLGESDSEGARNEGELKSRAWATGGSEWSQDAGDGDAYVPAKNGAVGDAGEPSAPSKPKNGPLACDACGECISRRREFWRQNPNPVLITVRSI